MPVRSKNSIQRMVPMFGIYLYTMNNPDVAGQKLGSDKEVPKTTQLNPGKMKDGTAWDNT